MFKTLVLVFIGLSLRLVLAVAFEGNYDQHSYRIVADIMARGGNVYAETHRYNYTPLWMHLLHLLDSLRASLPFHVAVRSFLSLVDVLNAHLIAVIAHRLHPGSYHRALTAYLLNPLAIVIVGYHGQFETLAALPLLVAVVRWLYRPGAGRPAHQA